MRKMWIVIGIIVVALAAGTIWMLTLPPNPNVGDRGKLAVTYTAEEQQKLDTVTVSQQELAAANCQDGAKCYLAVDGVVYDMSGFPSWMKQGRHHGVEAGTDSTEAFVKSGHGREHLEKMPVVGRLGS